MGTVARSAILGGNRVPLKEVKGEFVLDSFTRQALSSFGFLEIAQKVARRAALSADEITRLLTDAPPSVLMKLVSINHGGVAQDLAPRESPVPAVVIPLAKWLSSGDWQSVFEKTKEVLACVAAPRVEVFFDGIDVIAAGEGKAQSVELSQFAVDVLQSRAGVTLVAPSVDELIVSPGIKRLGANAWNKEVQKTLSWLKSIGFRRLRVSSRTSSLKLSADVGFSRALRTDLSDYATAQELADELVALQQLTGLGQDIDLWCPACSGRGSRRALGCEATEGAANLTLLRFLAIGTICLPYVPSRRASSAHFSLEALNLARYFGANDFGFGAANEDAETVLSLKRLDLVRAAVSRKN